jgi:hypothetical protein
LLLAGFAVCADAAGSIPAIPSSIPVNTLYVFMQYIFIISLKIH